MQLSISKTKKISTDGFTNFYIFIRKQNILNAVLFVETMITYFNGNVFVLVKFEYLFI